MNIELTEQQHIDLQDEICPLLCNEIVELRARLNRVYAERDNAHYELTETCKIRDTLRAQVKQLEADSFIEAEATDYWIKQYNVQSVKLQEVQRFVRYALRGILTEREGLEGIDSVIAE